LQSRRLSGQLPSSLGSLTTLVQLVRPASTPSLLRVVVRRGCTRGMTLTCARPLDAARFFSRRGSVLTSSRLWPAPPTDARMQVLWNNTIGGSIPASLGSLTSLTTLCVVMNDAMRSTDAVARPRTATDAGRCAPLPSFPVARRSLFTNQLTGELPSVNFATKLTKLTDLVLNNNLLTGSLPSSFGSFASLRSMYAQPHAAV
jgi:hypothetical protein